MKFLIRIAYQISKMLWILVKPYSIGVRLLMVRDQQVLLVKHVYENLWYLPGGLVEKGETFDEAIHREALEEVGASFDDLELFGAYTNVEYGKSDHVIVFITRDFSFTGQTDGEIEEFGLFDFQDLPHNVSPGSERRIREYIQGKHTLSGRW
jgi:8-oxo-dGTP pyrophosphatase MutT (NUDIX family)